MSDRMAKRKDLATDWKPLNIHGAQSNASDTFGASPSADVEKHKEFQILYRNSNDRASGVFCHLYSRESDRASGKAGGSFDGDSSGVSAQESEDDSGSSSAADSESELLRQQAEALKQKEQEAFEEGFHKGEKAGYEAGFAKGEKDGFDSGIVVASEKASHLEDILSEVDSLWQNLVQRYEKQILSLICRIAEKVVYGQAAMSHDIVKDAILNAFAEIPEPEEVALSVNPDDYEYIQLVKEEFFKKVKDLKQVSVLSNPSVPRGGCKIETRSGRVETTIESRLEAVQRRIVEVCSHQG